MRFDEVNSSEVLLGNSQLTIERNGETKVIQVPPSILEQVSDMGRGHFVEPRFILGKVSDVPPGNAKQAGILKGDSILTINTKPIKFYDEFQSELLANKGKFATFGILRANSKLEIKSNITDDGKVGIAIPPYLGIPIEQENYGFFQSLPVGASKAIGAFTDNAKGIGKVVTGQVKANKAFAGPVGIANMFGAEVNWIKFWGLVGVLSMALALMNLLPIPALDGGHAVFLVIEMIKGKPLGDKFMEKAQIVGFVILVALMVFVLGNDILKYVVK
jgi:regulator of sigma E protease